MPPNGPVLGVGATRLIEKAIERVLARAKARTLGPWMIGKGIAIDHNHRLSIPGLFEAAAREEGASPDMKALKQLLQIAGGYVDALESSLKAKTVREVGAFLADAHRSGVKTDLKTVLGGKLTEIFDTAKTSMRRIVDAELNTAKNISVMEAGTRIAAAQGIDDPLVAFITPIDDSICSECLRLHVMPDGKTPRVWKMSELKSGYAKKGDPAPSLGGQHPHCRGTLTFIQPGFGFGPDGRITYVSADHDELKKQRS